MKGSRELYVVLQVVPLLSTLFSEVYVMRKNWWAFVALVSCLIAACLVKISISAENADCVWELIREGTQSCTGSSTSGACDVPCNVTSCSGSRTNYSGVVRMYAESTGSAAVKQTSVPCRQTILCEIQLEDHIRCVITPPLTGGTCGLYSLLHNCAYCADGTPLAWVQTTTMVTDPSVNCSSSGS